MMFIAFVRLHSNLLLCWRGFHDIIVTVIKVDERRGMLAEAVIVLWLSCQLNNLLYNIYDWHTNHSPQNIMPDQLLL